MRSGNVITQMGIELASPGKPKLRSLITQSPSNEEITAVRAAFDNGTPLEMAILAQAIIEHELETLLRAKFKKKDDSTWTRLTNHGAPLGTFSNKLIAGFAFGLYDEITLRNMNTVREIRNVFAHSKRLITFSEPAIVRALKEVSLPEKAATSKYKRLSWLAKDAQVDPKWAFQILCYIIFLDLSRAKTRLYRAQTRSMMSSISTMKRQERKTLNALPSNPFLPSKTGPGQIFRQVISFPRPSVALSGEKSTKPDDEEK